MTTLWCPGARIVNVGPGGVMLGGKPRAVHHTTEGSTIDGAIATYRQTHDYPTFTIDYARDDVVQHLPANVSATALRNPAGGVETNRLGTYCIQIEWIGQAVHPFTIGRDAGPKVRAFFDWMRDLGIPNVWPMGAPMPYPASYGLNNGDRNPTVWVGTAGHYGHSQVPENDHGDPGAINPTFISQTARSAPVAPRPVVAVIRRVIAAIRPKPHRLLWLTAPMMSGPDVAEVAAALGRRGFNCGLPASVFGPQADRAVRGFQAKARLGADGVVGPATRKALGLSA